MPPLLVQTMQLGTARRRIDFKVPCQALALARPHYRAAEQRINDRLRRADSGFTALFEALPPARCRGLPVRRSATLLRCTSKKLWRRIEHYVAQAREPTRMHR